MLTNTLKDAAVAAAQSLVDALTAWPTDVPERGLELAAALTCAEEISAVAVPPAYVRYPDADLVLSEREQLFGDYPGPAIGAVSASQMMSLTDRSFKAGNWVNEGNAPFKLENIGGDWKDAADVNQGPTPFATIPITDLGSAVPCWVESTDLTGVVQGFIDGKYPNWGFALKNADNGAVICDTMYCTNLANRPQLVITSGGVDSTLTPQAMVSLYGTQLSTQSRLPTFQFAKNNLTYVYFDLDPFFGQTITSAKLRLHSTNQFGNSVGQVFRARNHAMETPRSPVTYGIAKDFPEDAGLEGHPSVLMAQKFGPDFENYWMGGLGVKYPSNNSMIERITDPAQMLLGKYPGIRIYHRAGGLQGALERHSALWRGFNSLRMLPTPPRRIFIRYYARFNDGRFGEPPWRPGPTGGKLPGVNGRFTAMGAGYVNPNWPILTPTLPGCGVGNSGNHCSGGGGCSARGNYDQVGPVGTPMYELAGFGNADCYNADQMGQYGDNREWSIGLGGHARLGEIVCIEGEYWVNTQTDETQKQVRLASIINNNDGTATATVFPGYTLAGNPKYVTGEKWTTMGSLMVTEATTGGAVFNFNQVGAPITVLSDTQFSYPIPPKTATHAIPANGPGGDIWLTAVAAQGNFDGGMRGWVNGRLVGENASICFWHSAWLPDGVTPIGWDTVWWCVYQGGGKAPNVDASMDMFQPVVSTERIGPLVLTP